MDQFFNVSGQLLEGFGENCIIFIVTLLAAIPLGLIISMGSMSKFKPLKWLTKTFEHNLMPHIFLKSSVAVSSLFQRDSTRQVRCLA